MTTTYQCYIDRFMKLILIIGTNKKISVLYIN